eukprot:jgi/Orpsp1_1/1191114/evm.model.d7180000083593.1
MKIGYQGDIGSNSEAAAKAYFLNNDDNNYEFIPLLNSKNVFDNLLNENIDIGVVAVTNSLAGEVQETKEALKNINPTNIATITIPIHHCLFCKGDINKCSVVMSHPQALKQTKNKRNQKFKWLEELEIGDQAKAAKDLSIGKYPDNYAVICRKNAGENVGLILIAENIEDDSSNKTTF